MNLSFLMRLYRPAASAQLPGFRGNSVKGYYSLQETQSDWEHACASRGMVLPQLNSLPSPSHSSNMAFSHFPTPSYPQPSPSPMVSSSRSSASPSPSPSPPWPNIKKTTLFIPQHIPRTPPVYTPSPSALHQCNAMDNIARALSEVVHVQLDAHLPAYTQIRKPSAPPAPQQTTPPVVPPTLITIVAAPVPTPTPLFRTFEGHQQVPIPPMSALTHQPAPRSSTMPTSMLQLPVASSSQLQPMPSGLLSNEEAWWVVLHGNFPGTYHGKFMHKIIYLLLHSNTLHSRVAAKLAAGTLGQIHLRKVGSYDQACHLFSAAVMAGEIVQYFE